MQSNLRSKLRAAGTGLAVALTLGACAGMAPKAYQYVPPPLGSSWVYTRHDTGSYGSRDATYRIDRRERMWQGQEVISFEGPADGTIIAQMDGGWLAIVRGDTPILSWNPPANWDYPLELGKTWTKSTVMTIHAAKKMIPYSYTGTVEAYEDVSVPAGTFKAFRVHSTDTIGNDMIVWLSPKLGIFVKQHLVRTSENASGPGTRDVELISQDVMK